MKLYSGDIVEVLSKPKFAVDLSVGEKFIVDELIKTDLFGLRASMVEGFMITNLFYIKDLLRIGLKCF